MFLRSNAGRSTSGTSKRIGQLKQNVKDLGPNKIISETFEMSSEQVITIYFAKQSAENKQLSIDGTIHYTNDTVFVPYIKKVYGSYGWNYDSGGNFVSALALRDIQDVIISDGDNNIRVEVEFDLERPCIIITNLRLGPTTVSFNFSPVFGNNKLKNSIVNWVLEFSSEAEGEIKNAIELEARDDNRLSIVPSVENSDEIIQWTGSIHSRPYFGYPRLEYSTISGSSDSSKFNGGVLAKDGRVIFVPYKSSVIGVFDPADNSYTTYTGPSTDSVKFTGGVLAPDGRVVFIPFGSSVIGVFNPSDNSYITYTGPSTDSNKFFGGVLAPDGRVVFVPFSSSVIGVFDPTDNSYTTYTGPSTGSSKFNGGILAPDGRVIFIPYVSSVIGVFDPADNSYTTYGSSISSFSGGVLAGDGRIVFVPFSGSAIGVFDPTNNSYQTYSGPSTDFNKFTGGVLAPDGRIIFVPLSSSVIGVFNPTNNSYTTIAGPSTDTYKFWGGVLTPDGRIVFIPYNSNIIGVLSGSTPHKDTRVCLHPFYNKF